LLGWGLVIAIMPALIHVFSWLGQRYPSSEGVALYASMGLGNWSRSGIMLITCGTLAVGMPAFFLVGGNYIATLLKVSPQQWAVPCALVLAVATTLINLMGLEKLGFVNKLVVALVLCMVGYISIRSLPTLHLAFSDVTTQSFSSISVPQVWLAMTIVFWAFQGWENMTFGFEEIENPKTNIPLIYWISFALVSIIYIVFALAIFAGAKAGINVSGLNGVAALLPDNIWGQGALAIMVFILVANANSWVFGSSRAFFSATSLKLLPKSMGILTSKGIPAHSLIVAMFVYVIVIMGMWVFNIDEKYAFLLTTQGFIILYGGAILAFLRSSKGIINKLIGLLAGASWIFLMQGFGWMILYPIFLLLLGIAIDMRLKISNAIV
jgi:APA family basic amino acid/polyamine antiporter/amino acid efflux transporter